MSEPHIEKISLVERPELNDLHDRLFDLMQKWSSENPTVKVSDVFPVIGILVGYLLAEVDADHREIVRKSLMMSADGSLRHNMNA